jgi:DNA-binding response OmpR family regulator
MMPGLNGVDVVRAVRLQTAVPYVHMILLTSRQSKEDIIAGLDSGVDDYLTKPFDPEELRARLRTGERILSLEDNLVQAREEMRIKATHDPLTRGRQSRRRYSPRHRRASGGDCNWSAGCIHELGSRRYG